MFFEAQFYFNLTTSLPEAVEYFDLFHNF